MVTTSNASDWSVQDTQSQSPIKWYALGNTYQGNTPVINFSGNVGSETVVLKSSRGLLHLECDFNQLTFLDVSKNVSLTYLYGYSNQLKVLDVTKNVWLTLLSFSKNQLTELDVTKNVRLTQLYCESNQLTALDVSKNTGLTDLYCRYNPNLTTIYVNQTQLDKLNGVIAEPQYWDWRKDPTATYVLKQ
ncbi:hypothetical protein F7647_10510 [Tenacibaculum piscium]|nr:hypothetical protein [Tenacibaculum piscium]MBE7686480.1 hypothetical protein [Tenacibaculum piscium]